ncbi:hypothetical protein IHE49_08545 [Rhodanobacter sp. 7MK24]|uniref:ArnT family glycosyltransferase n=1 Tax=Rhodanobacter sp. 7MK24 TaxID=2775922 RepID=UPI001780DB36|nr:hypothetical protein [Rhodanobacter sp. 7MK24]MBD8880530.1 hypothetical protein [Rhodanobacter sp. 7MK24]
MPARTRALLALTITVLVCLALYWPAMHGPFLFDDFPNLAALDSIDHVSSWRDLGIYLSQPRNFPGRPVAMLSFLLQKASWPDHPFPFRLVNVSIHLLNGVLVFALVYRIARQWLGSRTTPGSLDNSAYLAACLTAAAWLLNPIQLSGVVLVVQRMTLLMAMFMLLGLLAYIQGLLATELSTRRRGMWMVLGLGACMGLAFLSKENGILLPMYALVLDATLLRTNVQRLPPMLAWLRRLLIWPAVVFVVGYLIWILPAAWGHHDARDFTVGQRLLTEPRILCDYLGKIFLPRFGLYGLYHDGYVVSHSLTSPWTTLPALLALLCSLVMAALGLRRWPLLALAVLWYLGGQLLESSTVMLELYFEHRNYVPLIGPLMALALALAQLPQGHQQRMLTMLSGLWLLACCITTTLSARVYASEDHLALVWANSQPDSVRAQTYLAERLYKHGQSAAALQVIDKAAQLHPNDASLAENGAFLKCEQGNLTQADLSKLDVLLRTAIFDRSGMEGIETLRQLAAQGKCPALTPATWLSLADALLANPEYHNNGLASGFLHYQRHSWAVSQGNLGMAIHELEATWLNDPDAEIPRLEAKYMVSAGLYDQAVNVLRDVDYNRLPLLRRLLVNDRAINAADIVEIEKMRKTAEGRATGKAP